MLGVLILAVAAAQASPSPPPLKTIIHERVSPFCTALHEAVGPAVKALIENKVVIGNGKSLFFQMAQDQLQGAKPMMRIDFHMAQLDNLIEPMVQNLAATDAALSKLSNIPNPPRTDDERRLLEMRTELMQVADEQRKMLNVFSGTYASFTSNELLAHGNPLAGAIVPDNQSPQTAQPYNDSPTVPIVVPEIRNSGTPAASPAPQASATPVPVLPAAPQSRYMGLLADTAFAHLFNELTTYQLHEAALESQTAQSILQSAAKCR